MVNIAYIDGNFIPENESCISIFDRSILFSDAVYEVVCVWNKQILDYKAHIERLKNSLRKLDINFSINDDEFLETIRSLIQKNNLEYGVIYLQVTRGSGVRDFIITEQLKPILFMFALKKSLSDLETLKTLKLQSYEDKRWGLTDIKTTQLLYASLTKTDAQKNGKDDSLFVKDGFITEASSANFYIVTQENQIITRPLDGTILPGITRATLLKIMKTLNIEVIERKFTVEEAQNAKEAFISSASSFVQSVVSLDDKTIGSGEFGELTKKLRLEYFNSVSRV